MKENDREKKKEKNNMFLATHRHIKQQHALHHARYFDVFNVVAEVIVWILL